MMMATSVMKMMTMMVIAVRSDGRILCLGFYMNGHRIIVLLNLKRQTTTYKNLKSVEPVSK